MTSNNPVRSIIDPASQPTATDPASTPGNDSPANDDASTPGMITVAIVMPAAALEALEQLATLHGHSRSAEARAAVRAHLERYGLGDAMPIRHEKAKYQYKQ